MRPPPLWVVRAEDTAFEQRASLKARGYRWDDGEGKRVKVWWLMTNDPKPNISLANGSRTIQMGQRGPLRRFSRPAYPLQSSQSLKGRSNGPLSPKRDACRHSTSRIWTFSPIRMRTFRHLGTLADASRGIPY
jgi:hypothetical protein